MPGQQAAAAAPPRPPTLRLSGVAVISVMVLRGQPFQELLDLLRVDVFVQRVQAYDRWSKVTQLAFGCT